MSSLNQTKSDKMKQFNIGDNLDIFCEKDKSWVIAKIIELKPFQIKIQFYTWSNKWNMWFDKQSKHIAKLHTHTLPILRLTNPPKYTQNKPCTKPILHKRNLILCASYGIFKYDLITDTYCKISEYKNKSGKISYDARNELIYITNGSSSSFDIFNLKN
eukprot:408356_1